MKEIAKTPEQEFDLIQRKAKALSASTMIPKDYQNNIPNTLVALEMANRIGASSSIDIVMGTKSSKGTY